LVALKQEAYKRTEGKKRQLHWLLLEYGQTAKINRKKSYLLFEFARLLNDLSELDVDGRNAVVKPAFA
jgi:hypothetical protein